MNDSCPLCRSENILFFHTDKLRHYFQCQVCQLVFVDPSNLPSLEREKHEYDLHQNNPDDEGYKLFLGKLANALNPFLSRRLLGLDFGCGQTHLLGSLFESHGHKVDNYDPIYFPEPCYLDNKYDFIVCSEAIEHFHTPHKEWKVWLDILHNGGFLAIMTKRVKNKIKFANWHYKNDVTHVSFFSEYTFMWLATKYGFHAHFPAKDIVILKRHFSVS